MNVYRVALVDADGRVIAGTHVHRGDKRPREGTKIQVETVSPDGVGEPEALCRARVLGVGPDEDGPITAEEIEGPSRR